MTIGFVVSFFDFRNDVRRVITEVCKTNAVVVFCKQQDVAKVENFLSKEVSLRIIDEYKNSSWNTFWQVLFSFMRKIPASKHNYYLMELFKIYNVRNEKLKKRGLRLFSLHKLLPKIISYDFLLRRLRYSGKTNINDIDHFLFFSEVADDLLLSRILNENKKAELYVYSWDHPCKHTRFSKRLNYLCWSEGIKDDLIKLQAIPSNQIRVAGASQFGYIDEFLNAQRRRVRKFPFDYYYFGCAIGIKELVADEIAVIRKLASQLQQTSPHAKLIVRPYPVLDDWSYYDELAFLQNVVVENDFRNNSLGVTDENILIKFDTVYFAKAFFHLGTTLGLEAALIDTPSFIIDFGDNQKKGISIFSFIHQYQNDKYLKFQSAYNSLQSIDEFKMVLADTENVKYREINKKLQTLFPVMSFSNFAKAIAYV